MSHWLSVELEEQLRFGRLLGRLKRAVERLVRRQHAEVLVEDDERDLHRLDDVERVVARPFRVGDVVLERVDVDERQDGAVDLVVGVL